MRRGEEIIAELVVTGGDFPWLNALVRPTPGFEEVRPLFQEEPRALERMALRSPAMLGGATPNWAFWAVTGGA